MDRFTLQRPFNCEYAGCNAKFESSRELRLHVAVHNWGPHSVSTDPVTGTPLFRCLFEGCDRVVTDRKVLRKHLLTHRPRQFKCDYPGCDKRFYERAKLKRHFLVHSGEKQFVCEARNCGKSFAYKANLKTHMRTHSGERPFACTYPGCKKRFAQASNRNSHVLIHARNKSESRATATRKLGSSSSPRISPQSIISHRTVSSADSSTSKTSQKRKSMEDSPLLAPPSLRIFATSPSTRTRADTNNSVDDASPNSSSSTPLKKSETHTLQGIRPPSMQLETGSANAILSPKRRDTVNSLLFLSNSQKHPMDGQATASWPPKMHQGVGMVPGSSHMFPHQQSPMTGPHFAPAVGNELAPSFAPHGHVMMSQPLSAMQQQQFGPQQGMGNRYPAGAAPPGLSYPAQPTQFMGKHMPMPYSGLEYSRHYGSYQASLAQQRMGLQAMQRMNIHSGSSQAHTQNPNQTQEQQQ